MAKKAATKKEFSVEDKLRALHQLQVVDSEIDKIRTVRGELPLEVQDLEDEVQGLELRLSKINEDVSGKELFISGRKIAIDEAKTLIKKYKKQLDGIKNNREYDSLNKEIEFQELEVELAEKKINEATAKVEFHSETKVNTETSLSDCKDLLTEKTKELEGIVAETEKEEKALLKLSGKLKK
jgi:hypothetical protein